MSTERQYLCHTPDGAWLLDDGGWLRPADIADMFGVKPHTVEVWRQRRILPDAYVFCGIPLRRREALTEWGIRTKRLDEMGEPE